MSALVEGKLRDLKKIGVSDGLAEVIGRHIETAPPAAVYRLQPHRAAARWGVPYRQALDALLYGTRLGIFDLSWDIRCPSCRGRVEREKTLAALRPSSHCDYCHVDIVAGFDDAVEVSFRVNSNLREFTAPTWWDYVHYWGVVEPRLRLRVAAGATERAELRRDPGTFHILRDGYGDSGDDNLVRPFVAVEPAQDDVRSIRAIWDGERMIMESEHYMPAGPGVLELTNRSSEAASFTLIYEAPFPWLSAAELGSYQSFRDLFLSELISPDESFAIRSQTFVFTDIKGSTALYDRLGDARAYKLVKDHFKILTHEVKRHNGAVVKTIGDAVMATFHVSRDAVASLFAMQRAFAEFNAGETHDEVIIKVGAHAGPCIAVTSNERLDYFGQTVNIAARVQGLSNGRDILLSRSLHDEPPVREVVDASGWISRRFQAPLKGISELYDVVHLRPKDA